MLGLELFDDFFYDFFGGVFVVVNVNGVLVVDVFVFVY